MHEYANSCCSGISQLVERMLKLGDRLGLCRVCDPVENYKVELTSQSYEEAQLWLLEDEFEPINGKLAITC